MGDPDRALLVREAFRLYATGEYSLAELQATMHTKGLTSPYARKPGAPISVSKLAEMLANPFYVGVVQWGGVRYAGNCHTAYVKARPSVRRRFNDAVLEAVYIKDRGISRAEFSDVFAPLFSRPGSNKRLRVDLAGRCVNRLPALETLRRQTATA